MLLVSHTNIPEANFVWCFIFKGLNFFCIFGNFIVTSKIVPGHKSLTCPTYLQSQRLGISLSTKLKIKPESQKNNKAHSFTVLQFQPTLAGLVHTLVWIFLMKCFHDRANCRDLARKWKVVMYRRFQVSCPPKATRIQACAEFVDSRRNFWTDPLYIHRKATT